MTGVDVDIESRSTPLHALTDDGGGVERTGAAVPPNGLGGCVVRSDEGETTTEKPAALTEESELNLRNTVLDGTGRTKGDNEPENLPSDVPPTVVPVKTSTVSYPDSVAKLRNEMLIDELELLSTQSQSMLF